VIIFKFIISISLAVFCYRRPLRLLSPGAKIT